MIRRFGAAMVVAASAALTACNPVLPPVQRVDRVVYASPGWDTKTREEFYWRQQGTIMMPVAWFQALEEPEGTRLISDRDYLSRFGFLTDGVPEGQFPIGFTPYELGGVQTLGMGCAACHTGQLNYKGIGIRIDGGAALQDTTLFSSTLGKSVIMTNLLDEKFERFARRVLGDTYGAETKAQLKQAFAQAAGQGARSAEYEALHDIYPVTEGNGRLDALQRIANTLLGDDLSYQPNKKKATAPVSLPHIWDAPFFDWVQYNGSVRQPMIRNAGESLGVKAKTNFVNAAGLVPAEPALWATSIPVWELHHTEQDLRKLHAPLWPKELPAPDPTLAYGKGKQLFDEMCAGCHAKRPFARDGWKDVTFLQVPVIDVKEVGTDANLLDNFLSNTYDATALGIATPIGAGQGLWVVTEKVKDFQYNYGTKPVPKDQRPDMDGFGWPNEVRGTCGYKSRPLEGVWATPPFLHNGSVPTMYDLLSTAAERPRVFWVGNREFDPVKLGYVATEMLGITRFDIGVTGNSNAGHEFDDSVRSGVIGRKLVHDEKMAIIEYLKVLAEDRTPATRKAQIEQGDYRYPCWEKGIWFGPDKPRS